MGDLAEESAFWVESTQADVKELGIREACPYLFTTRNYSLERFCSVVTQVFDVQAAAIAVSVDGVSRIIAAHGQNIRYKTYYSFFMPELDGGGNDMFLHDARENPRAQFFAQTVWTGMAGFFARRTLLVDDGCSIVLGVFDAEPRPPPTPEQMRLFERSCAMIRGALISTCRVRAAMARLGGLSLDQVSAQIVANEEQEILLDEDLRIVCSSIGAKVALGEQLTAARTLAEFLLPGAAESLIWLARRTLDTGISPPEQDFSRRDSATGSLTRVLLAPLVIEDRKFLIYRREDVATVARETDLVARSASIEHAPDLPGHQPVFDFLDQTLVPRRRVNARKGATYVTLRSWRKPIAAYQIRALASLKTNLPAGVADRIATAMIGEVNSLVGVDAFHVVVPMPCGHEREGLCLSREIGAAVARQAGLQLVEALATRPRKGASHPKENVRRPPLQLVCAPTQPVLLVDDVATSGAHLEEAINLVRPAAKSVLAIAWIGGAAN